MNRKTTLLAVCAAAGLLAAGGCGKSEQEHGYRVYVTNEASGDLSIIDPVKMEAVTVPLGKRARGIHPSADGKLLYVALSGSPLAPPGVDESTLPPPDKSADGIGVFDIAQNKMVRKVPGGSDPEQFAIAKDGKLLYVSNEDAAGLSFVDPTNGQVLKTVPTGREPEGVMLSPGRQVHLCDVRGRGHRGSGGCRGAGCREKDQGGTPSARHRVPAGWIARFHHQ